MSEAKKPAARKSTARKPSEKAREIAPPADHQKPTAETEAVEVDSYTVVVRDREWSVSSDALDDFELLEKLATLNDGGPSAVSAAPSALRGVLGAAQFGQLMEVLRDPDTGRVPVAAGVEFLQELFAELNPNS
ncbi:hypothetical protein [Tessaracoccus massiliensis]|uniref:hypothetical protein n=1 Tax=Tessaracoccus massiliensis TaxID=1522311 RepID=UPI00058D6838|nr:hypothetical protein [Tessaracoccus massiliensis]